MEATSEFLACPSTGAAILRPSLQSFVRHSMSAEAVSTPAAAHHPARPALIVGALGIVFGDIGTSPIYAFRESLKATNAIDTEWAVLGVLSMIVWAVLLVVAIKYVLVVMRADNQGEGGTIALLTLAYAAAGRLKNAVLLVGLIGASLFFGDAMITPAISVLSAVEGLNVATPLFESYVVPIAAVILVCLFALQRHGSGRVGRVFGPMMALWFLVLAIAGIANILSYPSVLRALDPWYAIAYFAHADAWSVLMVLGSVFLALTGAEALYADMGHFGRPAITFNWFVIVMPALVLVYFGQGAVVLATPSTAANPFFFLFPQWSIILVVMLATAATIIASQAVISGAFALVQQAIQLGVLPRLDVRQTSDERWGQVYVPQVNWLLAVAVLGLVLGFRSSDALANAYGIAVAGDMLVTSFLVAIVARGVWGWPIALVVALAAVFLCLDATFVTANIRKIPGGGWFPLLISALALTLMLSWRRGRAVALARRDENAVTLTAFIDKLDTADGPRRVPGVAVYLTAQRDIVPAALALNIKHNRVLHEHIIILRVLTERAPRVPEAHRIEAETLVSGMRHATLRFGFAEKPDVLTALQLHADVIKFDPKEASFFLGREVPVPSLRPEVPIWQERLYAFMTMNAVRAPDYFLIPVSQVVELGTKVEL
jgi:KUP system potassium uptake protein